MLIGFFFNIFADKVRKKFCIEAIGVGIEDSLELLLIAILYFGEL